MLSSPIRQKIIFPNILFRLSVHFCVTWENPSFDCLWCFQTDMEPAPKTAFMSLLDLGSYVLQQPCMLPSAHACCAHTCASELHTRPQHTVLEEYSSAPGKPAPSSTLSERPLFSWMRFPAGFSSKVLRVLPSTLSAPQWVFCFTSTQSGGLLWLIPSSVCFLQDSLRQLIAIPLPDVLLLSRTPYCGTLFILFQGFSVFAQHLLQEVQLTLRQSCWLFLID